METRLAPVNVLDEGTNVVLKAVVCVGRSAAAVLTGTIRAAGGAGGARLTVVLA